MCALMEEKAKNIYLATLKNHEDSNSFMQQKGPNFVLNSSWALLCGGAIYSVGS